MCIYDMACAVFIGHMRKHRPITYTYKRSLVLYLFLTHVACAVHDVNIIVSGCLGNFCPLPLHLCGSDGIYSGVGIGVGT